jgi:peptidyl-prolyl cis-trans isomerase D
LSEPIKTGFGYALYYVHSIDAQQLKPLDDKLKKEISYTIRLEKFGNKLYSSIEEMEDMQAGGATVEEIAKKYNLKLQKFEGISKMARDKNNDFLIGMPLEVLDEIFASTVNAEEPLFNLPDNKNYYFYRVDKIEEKNTPELKQVKKNVLADWKKDQFKMALKNKVDNYTKAINENKQTFDSVANELDKKVKETTIQRGQKNDVLNTYASNIIFEAKKGQNFTLEVDDGKSYIIANLEKIVPPVTDTKEAHLDIVKLQADNSTIVMQEVYGQLMRSVKEKIGVEVNTEMVKTVLERY